jgi:transcriptional regulator with XRE-family HTH domain
MIVSKKIKEFLQNAKKTDFYWVERSKLDFSQELEKRRIKIGFSYADLAHKIGTSPAYISKIFRGDANLTIESMVKLSRATGGKVEIRIVDENTATNPRVWFEHYSKKSAANQVISSETATVNSNVVPFIVKSNTKLPEEMYG